MNKKFIQWLSITLILLQLLMGCSVQWKETNHTSTVNNQVTENETKFSTDDSTLEVHYIDVGQGDCTLVICQGQSLLIDAGNNNKGMAVQMYLQKQGIQTLDYVIGTHPDSDHIGGLDVILYKFDCETVILPEYKKKTRTYDDVIQTMKKKNYKNTLPVVGTTYTLGSASFTIIAPNGSYGNNANDYSVSIVLQHGNNKFMFTGDAEEDSEEDILKNKINISADVYKISHHGSKFASTQEFLDVIKPKYAVISCGDRNSYGHPHAKTLNRLRSMGIKVFRTDEQGSIISTSDGQSITWNCSPSETWQAGEGSKSDREEDPLRIDKHNDATISTTEGTTYIVNINTKKFHKRTCSSVKEMISKNRSNSLQSKDELINHGYFPCGRCRP